MYLLLQWNEKQGGLKWSETDDTKLVRKHLKASVGFSWAYWREEGRHAREVLMKDVEAV